MEYSYYAFLDVMGYRAYLRNDIKHGTSVFREKLTASFRIFEEVGVGAIHYKSISDSIFISSQGSVVDFLKTIKKVYLSFLKNGLLIRGGVAYDQHFENLSITYSPALTEAYKLESEAAVFPRILIHSAVVEKARNEKISATNNNLDELITEKIILGCGLNYQLHVVDDENWNEFYDSLKLTYVSHPGRSFEQTHLETCPRP